MRVNGSALVPVLAGALGATAAVLVLGGWPGLPAVTGPAQLAAYWLVGVPVLVLLAAAAQPGSDLARDRLVAPRADPDRTHRRPGQLLYPLHVGAGVGRQLVEAPERRQVLEPAR
jgi:hypothetical protein